MADTTRLIGSDDLGGLIIDGTITRARPVNTLVRAPDGELYVSTNALIATYTQLTNTVVPLTFAQTRDQGFRFDRSGLTYT